MTLLALSVPICCAACAQTDAARLAAAGRSIGTARAAPAVAEVFATPPEDCRRTTRGGVLAGERLDVAVLRLDAALARQNARTLACADWLSAALRHP
ncbi:hypothetical protein [Pararhodobacter zhoushanensis]|uniref:hypothetical protein n=1 Tax=Pararhodobacter zhoushanensis TaxID=2479545 RepID=UPI0013E05B9E|nr:hypothetical protein [Pararhodobacter zhoushanensis]